MSAKEEVSPLGALFGCLFIIAFILGITMLMGWLCKIIADHFGYHQPLWIWCLGWFILTSILRSISGGSKA